MVRALLIKTAFLVMAHHRPEALARLIDRLTHPASIFFIHIEKRADIAEFRQALAGREAVRFVPEEMRVGMNYTGFGMPQAAINLLAHAVAESDAERFVLLSGVDYPIRPIAAILAEVALDRERIAIDRRCDPKGSSMFDLRAFKPYFGDHPRLNPRTGSPTLIKFVNKVSRYLPRRRYGWPIYYGSAWWILTRAAAQAFLDLTARHPERLDWFRRTRSPSEMVFQTLLKQTGRAGHIADDLTANPALPRHPRVQAATYVDFEGMSSGSPRTLGIADLDDILGSDALFARKCDAEQSAALIDALDVAAGWAVRPPSSAPSPAS